MRSRLRSRSRRSGWLGAGALAAALPLLLVASSAVAAAPEPDRTAPGGGFMSGLWMGSASGTASVSMRDIRSIIGASTGDAQWLTGAGVGIAMIDTGVAPVPSLPAAQVVNGPDLSFESQSNELRYLDTYGHGTHMAGIMVGYDMTVGFRGLAPRSKLTSIKVGTSNGAADVTQVIAAIDWVVKNKDHDPAYPIRVLNLSYGSGGTAPYWSDPLQYAVEQAWFNGIVVVVAAGNFGNDTMRLTNPATDQFAIGVGATSTNNTVDTADDSLATFSNQAKLEKGLDVLAPGSSVVSLRVPGSNVDESYPGARVGDKQFRGSGTSQAAAVTSAAVALLLQKRPSLTPDQVKELLRHSGPFVFGGAAAGRGYRQVNVNAMLAAQPPTVAQPYMKSVGTGTVETARGTSKVVDKDKALSGENTPFGPFNSATWAALAAKKTSWSGGQWLGYRLAADGWTGSSFASKTWGAAAWGGSTWSGSAWADPDWSGRYWSGRYWSGDEWSGRYWSSDDWSAAYWG